MNKEDLIKMFEAQDIVRRLWANTTNRDVENALKELDLHMTEVINLMGEK